MGFTKVSGQRKYYKLEECEKGQLLVEGIFVGEEQGKFGPQFLFRSSSELVVLGGGHLKYLVHEHLNPGMLCRVIYDGQIKLTSGAFKGKMSHQFELEVDMGDSPAKVPDHEPKSVSKATQKPKIEDKESSPEPETKTKTRVARAKPAPQTTDFDLDDIEL